METLNVNDIMICRWGYEQTNVDFYQVLKVTETTATICQIKKAVNMDSKTLTGKVMPLINEFDGKKMTRKMHGRGASMFIINKSDTIRKWNGEAARESYHA